MLGAGLVAGTEYSFSWTHFGAPCSGLEDWLIKSFLSVPKGSSRQAYCPLRPFLAPPCWRNWCEKCARVSGCNVPCPKMSIDCSVYAMGGKFVIRVAVLGVVADIRMVRLLAYETHCLCLRRRGNKRHGDASHNANMPPVWLRGYQFMFLYMVLLRIGFQTM